MNKMQEAFRKVNISSMVRCKYCSEPATLTTGETIYPNIKYLHTKKFWHCTRCNAYVGCHPDTEIPLGSLANEELRISRGIAHDTFDIIWQSKYMTRKEAYSWLSGELNISQNNCHIGEFDVEMCDKVVDITEEFLSTHIGVRP